MKCECFECGRTFFTKADSDLCEICEEYLDSKNQHFVKLVEKIAKKKKVEN